MAQKPPTAEGGDGGLAAARDHDVGVAALDEPEGIAQGVGAARAGGAVHEFGPLAPVRIETQPDARFAIAAGMKKGLILRGPPFRSASCSRSMVAKPPMPLPT